MDSITNGNENEDPDIQQERDHFMRIVDAFRSYRDYCSWRLNKSEIYLKTLPEHHRTLLDSYKQHLGKVRQAVDHNYSIIKLIIMDVETMFENVENTVGERDQKVKSVASSTDMDKVQSTIKQFVRDWSIEGAEERKACYNPILKEIEEIYPIKEGRENLRVLVPGAGLGRLAFEIAKRGFSCQGNEFSLFMLFASNFILNRCKGVNLYRLYPFAHQYTNNLSSSDQTRYIWFPDIDPTDIPTSCEFSMAAGDFMEIYKVPDTWDCISTCFFIDTASNIVAYIETIWKILKPGGYWINLGPLLYHFADMSGEDSIEPSYDEVRDIIQKFGFVFTKEQQAVKTTYAQNPYSMLRYEYSSVFFVCQKPVDTNNLAESSNIKLEPAGL